MRPTLAVSLALRLCFDSGAASERRTEGTQRSRRQRPARPMATVNAENFTIIIFRSCGCVDSSFNIWNMATSLTRSLPHTH